MNFYEKWVEYDYNPWIMFDDQGKVLTLNQEAQYLLAEVKAAEIFELALTYATQSYGFKTTMMDLEFGKYEFFGIMVGYEDNNAIAIKLYQKPPQRIHEPSLKALKPHNLYTLIDLAISTSSISRKHGFTTYLDPALPEVRIDPEKFILLLTRTFDCFTDETSVKLSLVLKTGETLKFEGKRHPIIQLSTEGVPSGTCQEEALKQLANEINGFITYKRDRIIFEMPMITG
jgi:hypothetical protein